MERWLAIGNEIDGSLTSTVGERWDRVVIERRNMAFQERVCQISEVREYMLGQRLGETALGGWGLEGGVKILQDKMRSVLESWDKAATEVATCESEKNDRHLKC
jgi:hypothetical protein